MAITRVHLLAKELNVNSKAIIAKCQAEGLDIKNHMSTISAGLAATIREWFSEGSHTTTVETAAPVDLEKVRVKRKRKTVKKPKAESEPAESTPSTQESADVQAAVTETPPVETETQPPQTTEAPVEPPQASTPQIIVERRNLSFLQDRNWTNLSRPSFPAQELFALKNLR